MNLFALMILIALVVEFVLGVVADLLNLKTLRLELPSALEGVYQPDEDRRSQEYTGTTTRFGLVSRAFNLTLLLSFWFVGGFNYLDQIIRVWGYASIMKGLLYIGILLIFYNLLRLPFSIYATFVIEERFGFNRTTPRVFLLDKVKGLAVSIVLGMPLLAGILALFEYGGHYAWLYCWLATIIFLLVVAFVAPIWILPFFNKFTLMNDGELKEAILNYVQAVGYRISNLFVMDGSKRSTKANAFFTGFGRSKRVALFDTLIEKHTVPELVAVLAHEVGHYKKRHILQGIVISIAHTGIIFFLLSLFLSSPGLYQAFYVEQQSIYSGLLFFGLLYTPIEVFLSMVLQRISRRNEYQADLFAVETIEEPQSLVDGLKRLSVGNLSNLTPHPFYVFLNYSHPPLLERVRAIQQYQTWRVRDKMC